MNVRADRVSLRWQLTAIAAAVVLSLIVRVPWIGGPFSRDESAAMTVAREMLHGELPNVTAWQQRHPGTYPFYFAASLLPVSSDAQLDVLALGSDTVRKTAVEQPPKAVGDLQPRRPS